METLCNRIYIAVDRSLSLYTRSVRSEIWIMVDTSGSWGCNILSYNAMSFFIALNFEVKSSVDSFDVVVYFIDAR